MNLLDYINMVETAYNVDLLLNGLDVGLVAVGQVQLLHCQQLPGALVQTLVYLTC